MPWSLVKLDQHDQPNQLSKGTHRAIWLEPVWRSEVWLWLWRSEVWLWLWSNVVDEDDVDDDHMIMMIHKHSLEWLLVLLPSLSLMILIATACYYHDMSWLWCFFVPRGVRSTRQGKMPKLIKQHTSACQWRGTGCWTHTVAERKSLYVFVPRAESGVRGKGKCQNWLSNTHQLANGAAQAAEPIQSQKESLCMSLCVHELDG